MRIAAIFISIGWMVPVAGGESLENNSAFVELVKKNYSGDIEPLPACPIEPSTLSGADQVQQRLTYGLQGWSHQAPSNARVAPRAIVRVDKNFAGSFASVALGGALQSLPESEGRLVVAATAKLTNRKKLEPWSEDFDTVMRQIQIADGLASYRAIAAQSSPRTALATLENMQKGDGTDLLDAEKIVQMQPGLRMALFNPMLLGVPSGIGLRDDDTTAIVAPDSPTSPGLLGGAPNGVPVALGFHNGTRCVRLAGDDDFKINKKTGRTGILWDPSAYPEVGQLHAINAEGETIKTCSVIALSASWALTAAHCVLQKSNVEVGYEWSPGIVPGDGKSAVLIFPRADVFENLEGGSCQFVAGDERCSGFYVAKLSGNPIFPEIPVWPADAQVPLTDISLLPIRFLEGAPAVSVSIEEPAFNDDVQIVGFGLSKTVSGINKSKMERASQIVTNVGSITFGWTPDGALSGSACVGDSGAPVYRGWNNSAKDQNKLLGVVSLGHFSYDATADNPRRLARYCEQAQVSVAKLSVHTHWICRQVIDAGFCDERRGASSK